ncbi:hypothetical protein ACVBGC_23365 [Burkholderia stagnalis]
MITYLYRRSPRLLLIATLTSLIGGLASAGMATVASRSITAGSPLVLNACAFFALCALLTPPRLRVQQEFC